MYVTVNRMAEMTGVCRQTILSRLKKGDINGVPLEQANDDTIVIIPLEEVAKFKASYARPKGAVTVIRELQLEIDALRAALAVSK